MVRAVPYPRFGEDSVERMVDYVAEWLEEESFSEPPYVLDLGTGNGHLLFAMLESEEMPPNALDAPRMLGVDYSPASIQLARAIGAKRGGACASVKFEEADLRDADRLAALRNVAHRGLGWDLVCDKGTVRVRNSRQYDAVREQTHSRWRCHRSRYRGDFLWISTWTLCRR